MPASPLPLDSSPDGNMFENMKVYLSDLLDVFYLLLYSDLVKSYYEKIEGCITSIYQELDANVNEPLLK